MGGMRIFMILKINQFLLVSNWLTVSYNKYIYKEDNIRIYDGILPFRKNNIIKSITREEFENEYGDFMFYDIISQWLYLE